MGSLCSKLSNHEDDHTVLSGTTNGVGSRPLDLRAATAEAAERRLQKVSFHWFHREGVLNRLFQDNNRGVVRTNPNKGRLAGKLERQRQGVTEPEPQLPEPFIVRRSASYIDPSLIVLSSTIDSRWDRPYTYLNVKFFELAKHCKVHLPMPRVADLPCADNITSFITAIVF